MYRTIAIILASTCMVYSRNLYKYRFTFPIKHHSGQYDFRHQVHPNYEKNLYSQTLSRTDESIQKDNVPLEKTLVSAEDVSANISLEKVDVDAQKSLESLEQETSNSSFVREENLKPTFWFDSALDEKPKPTSNLRPSYKTKPNKQENNDIVSDNEPLYKSYNDKSKYRPKYSDNYKSLNDIYSNSIEKVVHSEDKEYTFEKFDEKPKSHSQEHKHIYTSPSKSFERHIYQNVSLYKSYQEKPRERPKYTENYKKSDEISNQVMEHLQTKEEELSPFKFDNNPKLQSKEHNASPAKSYQRPNYQNDYKHSSSKRLPPKRYSNRTKYPKKFEKKLSSSETTTEYQFKDWYESKSYQKVPISSDRQITSIKNNDYDNSPSKPVFSAPHYPAEGTSGSLPAPPFYESLKDFDATFNTIRFQLFGPSFGGNKRYHSTMIAAALDGMIKTMANTNWRYYDREYDGNMPRLIRYTKVAKFAVESQLKCVYEWIYHSIKEIRAVMNNNLVHHICKVSGVPCDTLILVVVEASHDVNLQEQARLILALGRATRLYLNRYSKVLKRNAAKSTEELKTFLLNSKNFFRSLIEAASDIRKLLPQTYRCYDAPPASASF